ncbi:MAG TPA: hypothetical protein VEA99_03485 [Gemmatimonadaceae bacterium]|nr:hypothetical protein [Gemmatimonadaceae bacterium]
MRRLVIWSEPGTKVREIRLRPGLNIVWSPDAADRGKSRASRSALGHGSGKTLFCRLLRYCLGEDRFAPDRLRDSIASTFKDGLVGAEVVVDGRTWAIVRPIGLTRRTVAVQGGDLDAVASGSSATTGMAPFLSEVERTLLPEVVATLVPTERAGLAWLTALAWLSRDQECRFDGVLDWRSPASDSGSPVRPLADADRLEALRALLRALTTEELTLRREVSRAGALRDVAVREQGRCEWAVTQQLTRLATRLSVPANDAPPGDLAVDYFRKLARARLASTAVAPTGPVRDLGDLRRRYEEAHSRYERLHAEAAALQATIPEQEEVLRMLRGELAPFSFRVHRAEHPTCPICEVPVDRVLAEGCKLSHQLPDLEQIRARREQLIHGVAHAEERLESAKRRQERVATELSEARNASEVARSEWEAEERAREERTNAWYESRRSSDEVERLAELLSAARGATADAQAREAEIDEKRQVIAKHREEQSRRVIRHAARHFDAIIRELVGEESRGLLTLDGNGLHLNVELGGDRSTAAIDSLKVIAFDLAAMCMSIEGRTHAPAFLIHDSPREADLGLSVYHRLFELVRSLESFGKNPLFQYIITTTTRPPDALCLDPWLVLTLEGTPAERRLLARDL